MTAEQLRLEIDATRRAIRQDYVRLRTELDLPAKTKRAVAERPLPWLGGAAFLGFLLSGRRRSKKVKNKAGREEPARRMSILGVLLAAARLLFPLVRPQLTAFALRKLSSFSTKDFR